MSGLSKTTITDDIDVDSLKCIHDYVLMELFERLKTQGGLWLGKGKGTECVIGRVLSVGKELPNSYQLKGYPIGIDKGDIVLTMEYVGERVESPGGKYRILHAHGVWAKIKLRDQDSFDIAELEPMFAFILVEPLEDEVTKGGIFLAQGHDADNQMRRAKIVKVGPGTWSAETRERIPVEVKAGEEILMLRYAGADVTVNGRGLRLIDYADIKAVLEEGR